MLDNKIRTDVFISSTSIDLPEYREAVMKTLLGLGLFPIGMETWPKRGENPVDKCRRMVFDSHIYIGIFAHRYGWQPDGYGGKSITEMEYDWAGQKGILRLSYVIKDDYEWDESLKEKDKQKELDAFKQKVKTPEIGFFTTPDDLARQIAIDLSTYLKQSPNLDDYYAWLHYQSKESHLLMALSDSDGYKKRSITIDEVYTPLYVRHGITAMQMANEYKRLVLLGDPGGGKTVFMNYLAMCMAGSFVDSSENWLGRLESQGWTQGRLLPIPIILRDFAAGLTNSTFKAVLDYLHLICSDKEFEGAIDGMKQYLKAGQVLVLFDGLDEVPNEKREMVRDALHDFIQRYPYNRYIVTCRILSYVNREWQLREMDAIETFAPLNKNQIAYFVQAWYTVRANFGTITTEEARTRITELTERITDDDLLEMATNPMLLTVMTFVHNSTGTLPKEKARLYDQCVDWLMRRWKLEEFNTLFKLLKLRGEKDLYKILWEIAYDAHSQQADKQGVADISEVRLIEIVKTHVNNDLGLAQKFCNYVEGRAGLLLGRGIQGEWRVFTFPHRTFQEFLAGRYLLVNSFDDLAPKIAKLGVNWREVMLLACGYLVYEQGDDISVLKAVREILFVDPKTDDDWWGIFLIFDMLLVVGIERAKETHLWEQVYKLIEKRFWECIQNEQPRQRAEMGKLINIVGDPRQGVGINEAIGLPDIVWCHVPAGEFIMGSNAYSDDEKPAHKVYLDDFYMSRYLVTYAQYQAFENALDFGNEVWWDGFPDRYKRQKFDQSFQYANHPCENVTWYMAMAFCRWLTYHVNEAKLPMQVWDMTTNTYQIQSYQKVKITLPSEAEYEKSARGTDGHIYPWGSGFDTAKGNWGTTGINMTNAVGIFPNGESSCGVLDISGNVFKWTRSKFQKYKYDKSDGREDEAEDGENTRSLRGSFWNSDTVFARASYRHWVNPNLRHEFIGFFVVCHLY